MGEAERKDSDGLEDMEGHVLMGRYRIDKLLGRGGMGAVYRGHQLTLKRDVAIKVLHTALASNEQLIKRFEREAQSTGRLEHPNIVQVLEFGREGNDLLFIVMQLLEGGELVSVLGQPMDPIRATQLMIQICRGLEHAHSHGVIHRDLKPENVFLVRDHEGRELAKLVDFGIAKVVGGTDEHGEAMTRMGMVFGTPAYMSPEQATGVEVDERTDLYSAGAMFYEMLAGRPPFQHDDPIALIRMQVAVDPAPLPESVPAELQLIVGKLLQKTKADRYDSATAVREALEAFLAAAISGVINIGDMTGSYAAGSVVRAPLMHSSPMTLGPASTAMAPTVAAGLTAGSGARPANMTESELVAGRSGPAFAAGSSTLANSLSGLTRTHYIAGAGGLLAVIIIAMLMMRPGTPAPGADDDAGAGTGKDASALLKTGDENPDSKAKDPDTKNGTAAGLVASAGLLPVNPLSDAASKEVVSVVDAATLANIDKQLSAKNINAALALIQPLRDEHPKDPILLWREGRALALAGKKKTAALTRYGEAAEAAPALLDDRQFYAELYDLLQERLIRGEAVNLALQKLGVHGMPFLLERINEPDPNRALNYVDRHRVLDALKDEDSYWARVDHELNQARDLWQARKTQTPCTDFGAALKSADEKPSVYLLDHVRSVPVPDAVGDDEPATCENLPKQLADLQAKYEQLYAATGEGEGSTGGTAAGGTGEDSGGEPASPTAEAKASGTKTTSSSKSSGSKSSGGKPCKKGFAGGIFNPKCKSK